MPKKKNPQAENIARLLKLMAPLHGLPEFVSFIDELRQQRESAIADLCNDEVVKDDGLMRAAIGEIRAYNCIISLYQAKAEQEKEQAEQPIPQD